MNSLLLSVSHPLPSSHINPCLPMFLGCHGDSVFWLTLFDVSATQISLYKVQLKKWERDILLHLTTVFTGFKCSNRTVILQDPQLYVCRTWRLIMSFCFHCSFYFSVLEHEWGEVKPHTVDAPVHPKGLQWDVLYVLFYR